MFEVKTDLLRLGIWGTEGLERERKKENCENEVVRFASVVLFLSTCAVVLWSRNVESLLGKRLVAYRSVLRWEEGEGLWWEEGEGVEL